MSLGSTVRHSFIGRCARWGIHQTHRWKHPNGEASVYHLPGGLDIQLYPEGEIVEFLSIPGLFERVEVTLVGAHLKSGMKVVDVGANVGLYSIVAQQRVGAAGQIWAFEPSHESFARLKRNLQLNRCISVHPFQLALGDQKDGTLKLRSAKGFGDAYRYLEAASNAIQDGGYEEPVRVTTLDKWARDAGVETIDFLKVDVEGGEFRMLTGAREVLGSNPNAVVFFENESDWCRRAGCSQEDSLRLLEDLGFGVYVWNNRRKTWMSDRPSVLKNSMVWACRDRELLPLI